MRRLAIAAFLSIASHAVLLGMGPRWIKSQAPPLRLNRSVTLTLTSARPAPQEGPLASEGPEIMEDEPPSFEREEGGAPDVKRAAEENPRRKKRPQEKKVADQQRRHGALPSLPALPTAAGGREFGPPDAPVKPRGFHGGASPQGERTAHAPPGQVPSSQRSGRDFRDAVPLYRVNPPPKYPRLARRRGYEGTVLLEVLVDRHGKVGRLRLVQSSGYEILDRAAVSSVERWLFEPGMRGGELEETWVRIPIRFELE